ncbi:MAG TPA: exopolysaccharide biosynthesis protein, partial [Opitutales bacterium]|nr:exopolysaccharide biosynthesis protein [Opitutales bacterium]
ALGDRSFGPLLLLPGLIAFSPLSGIPGIATLFGVMLVLVSAQLLVGRKHFWLPEIVLRRSISRKRFEQVISFFRRVAKVIDRLVAPRLSFFVNGIATWLIACFCLLIGLIAPFMEVLPFVTTGLGLVVTILGFGLLARDGVLILTAILLFSGIMAAGILIAV